MLIRVRAAPGDRYAAPAMATVQTKISWRADSSTTRGTGHDGGGIFSVIHLDDAAAATMLALEHEGPAVYNIVDDEPAPVRKWLPVLANALGAKPPRHVAAWLARIIAGEGAVMLGTEACGASTAKAKKEPGRTLRYPSWRRGFTAAYRQPKPLTA
jgi:nucleoside-diphosphate-sugar epimerase